MGLLYGGVASAKLKGISKASLLIEELPKAAESCGITRDKIETSVRYILSNSKMKIVEDKKFRYPTLYIKVNVDYNSICYSSTRVELFRYIKDPDSSNWGDFIYYFDGGISSGGKSNHGPTAIIQLEDILKNFVVKHSQEN